MQADIFMSNLAAQAVNKITEIRDFHEPWEEIHLDQIVGDIFSQRNWIAAVMLLLIRSRSWSQCQLNFVCLVQSGLRMLHDH